MGVGRALCVALATLATTAPIDAAEPAVNDPRLELTLFADSDATLTPIVTPIGIAVDARNRVFVVESHTHTPDRDYPGPTSDRVKTFADTDGDGRADTVSIFADGFDDAMNLAFSPDGTLHVCHKKGVVALHDRDGDGVADERSELLRLETAQDYAHNCMLGITISRDGWIWASRGNVGGHAFRYVGANGATLEGYEQGGDIVRCRLDGSGLEPVATGFWNPFDIEFDRFGRLLCVDNDPDARGPNRLVHVIRGGDYGFQSHYGPSGRHAYDAWDGELPDTLPIASGTGEAPSGVIDASRAALPADYRDAIIVTSWGAHTIERFTPRAAGVSFRASRVVLIEGDAEFRPVGIDAGRDGAVYFTDWVKKDYPNHGRGRIWRLATRRGEETMTPRGAFDAYEPSPDVARLEKLLGVDSPERIGELRNALSSGDPFVCSAAVTALARPALRDAARTELESRDARVRLGALLSLRRARDASDDVLRSLLADPDDVVRRMALQTTGELRRHALETDLDRAVLGSPSAELLETWLATKQALSPAARRAYERRTAGFRINRTIDDALLAPIVADGSAPEALRALAIGRLRAPDGDAVLPSLLALARSGPPALRLEATRTLAASESDESTAALLAIARDRSAASGLRAESIVGLAHRGDATLEALVPLLDDDDRAVRLETVRALRMGSESEAIVVALRSAHARATAKGDAAAASAVEADALAFALAWFGSLEGTSPPSRPATDEAWLKALSIGGDPDAGRRAFFHPAVTCSTCHTVRGRGSAFGPDLGSVASSKSRREIIESILFPSREIAIQYQGTLIALKDGRVLTGIQFHFRDGGKSVSMIPVDGGEVKFSLEREVAHYETMESSLMPEDLTERMTVEEVRDLVAFLMTLR